MAIFILFAHRWTIKPLAIFLILLSAPSTYFISKYNVAVDTTMAMNVLYTDVSEVRSLLSVYMLPYIFTMIILPIIAVVNINIKFGRASRYLSFSVITSALLLIFGIGLGYINYKSIHRASNISNKYIIHTLVPINIIRSITSVLHQSIKTYSSKYKKEVVISGRVVSQDDLVVVLVVGESSRQKNFSLYGYDRRNTNPNLLKYNNLHILNGVANNGSTYLALKEIMQKDDIKLPAMTSKLGIETSCYVNYSLYAICDSVGEIEVSDCGHNGKCYDEDVIPLLENNLNTYKSGYRFVILHLGGGSHGPIYSDRHPPEFQIFKPQCFEADVVNKCSLDQLYNSYDNTVLYVDYVLDEIIKKLDRSLLPYVFIYLSDHGESLLEEGRIFHGMPPGIPLPPEQAQIPLIVKSSVPISVVDRKEYNQQDVYDTVLDLFSIETEILDRERVFIKKNK
jgi:lipid A ethanolaminephosphotransferase